MDSSIIYRFLLFFLIFISPVDAIEFEGKFIQGHFILGKTDPNANILIGKKNLDATVNILDLFNKEIKDLKIK